MSVKIEKNKIVYSDGTEISLYFNDGVQKVLEDGSLVPADTPTKTGPNGGSVVQTENDIAKMAANTVIEEEKRIIQNIKNSISQLEAQQTQRRIREATLGNQGAIDFLQNIENQINALRSQL
jgi:hypothetical protein